MFEVPSSSPHPSTPDSRRYRENEKLSTTPLGPPPTGNTAASFTPAGLPPSSLPMSSRFTSNGRTNLFGTTKSTPGGGSNLRFMDFAVPTEDSDASFELESQMQEEVPPAITLAAAASTETRRRGQKRNSFGEIKQQPPSMFNAIAHGFIPTQQKQKVARLDEPGDLILDTEGMLEAFINGQESFYDDHIAALGTAAVQLNEVWKSFVDTSSREGKVGPQQNSPFTRANYIGSLLLHINHPDIASSPSIKSQFSASRRASNLRHSIPCALLNWLNTYHNPYTNQTRALLRHKPSPAAHPEFWDNVVVVTIRGKFNDALDLLQASTFTHIREQTEFGPMAVFAEEVVGALIEVFRACPALHNDDWDVRGPDWSIWRSKAQAALFDLENLGSENRQARIPATGRGAGNKIFKGDDSFTRAGERADRLIPEEMYEGITLLYNCLLGNAEEITVVATDWLEATIFRTVWWDGNEDPSLDASLSMSRSRHSQRRSQQHPRAVDVQPLQAYKQKLRIELQQVNDDDTLESEFQVNTAKPLDVVLACALEDEVETCLRMMESWSLPITSSLVFLAREAGWLPVTQPSANLLGGFDTSDLMVLSYGMNDKDKQKKKDGLDPDQVLENYADALNKRGMISSEDAQVERHGWEMGIQVLSRMADGTRANTAIAGLLERLPISSSSAVQTVLGICKDLGLPGHAQKVAKQYADHVTENTTDYGEALVYYALAHDSKRIKDVLDLLISYCLVQSSSFPSVSHLDDQLRRLLLEGKATFAELAVADADAAEMLALYISGYATLRKFYDLRDSGVLSGPRQSQLKWREAFEALLAVIDSSRDSIRGGLYDESVNVIVPVDGLLALLGEALVFVSKPDARLKASDLYRLLQAVEDVENATPRIKEACEDCLKSSLAYYHDGAQTVDPKEMFKKSIAQKSVESSQSQFSMVGSSLLLPTKSGKPAMTRQGSSHASSGVLVDSKRGWDWRRGVQPSAKTGDIIRMMRGSVAGGLARVWCSSS